VLEVIRDDEAGPDVRRPIPARFLPHFHVRVTTFWNWSPTIHRVYASGRDLLFINLGVDSLNPQEASRRAAWGMGGGLLGALIGYYMAQNAQAKLDRIKRALEYADDEVLREFVRDDSSSFIVSADELDAVCLEPAGFWRKLFSS